MELWNFGGGKIEHIGEKLNILVKYILGKIWKNNYWISVINLFLRLQFIYDN